MDWRAEDATALARWEKTKAAPAQPGAQSFSFVPRDQKLGPEVGRKYAQYPQTCKHPGRQDRVRCMIKVHALQRQVLKYERRKGESWR